MIKIILHLAEFEKKLQNTKNAAGKTAQIVPFRAASRKTTMEFHIRREIREENNLEALLFSLTGNVVLADLRQSRSLAAKLNSKLPPEKRIKAGQLNAMGLIDEILHYMVALYREQVQADVFEQATARLEEKLGGGRTGDLFQSFGSQFPPQAVYAGESSVEAYLKSSEGGESNKALSLEEMMLLALANLNPAFKPFLFMFDDKDLAKETVYSAAINELQNFFAELPPFGPDGLSLWELLRAPALASDTLTGQLEFMRKRWGLLLSKYMTRLLTGLDVIKEEEKPSFFGPGPTEAYTYGYLENEYERFSPDQEWMPRTVLIAKSTLVWLFQLSQKYEREITRLDQIPGEELDELARRGFTGLWLIGLWERSNASKTIKQWTGNPEAAASAYSLYDYDIAGELGGWDALANLRERAILRGIRIGSDMVPNHTGIDSRWMIEHPERFLQLPYSPYPQYSFNCGNLSGRDDITVQIEENYFNRTDAAVVFRRIDNQTGETRFIYHGNDGTSMPWNDTAQIDFLNPEAREAVIRTIVGVCQQFPIVRFDAAMTLAKRHIQRLWYPEPGHGGDIASRAEHAITTEEFNRRIPNEFWREVVDRCAEEAPHTLLLAEAFWMMEGYFVRTLGMHRVYNSAFMNMLKKEENAKYRDTIKNTLEFDPEILKRFVNFMNNPDEETAVAQFGKGDKYFGICTLLVTMPGLPMFGHGQIEGFEEKYGMEYRRSYRDEQPDGYLVDRHEREIFPLLKKRYLFSGSEDFCLYDFINNGFTNENVFAYSNRAGNERSLILFNNSYDQASGWIKDGAVGIPQKDGTVRWDSLCFALGLHGETDCFAILREQRSGLWFIRSSKDIAEHGFFAALNGYEAQVYIDIHEVKDDEQGTWARIHHDLGGKGVHDLNSAKMDIVLGELYYRYSEIFKPGIDPADLKPLVLEFAETARKFIDGAGVYAPWTKPTAMPERTAGAKAAKKARTKPGAVNGAEKQKLSEPEKVWDDFSAYLERMIPIPTEFSEQQSKTAKLPKNTSLANNKLAAIAYAYASLALLKLIVGGNGKDAVSLVSHWELDRKLKEILCRLGIDGENAWHSVEIMKAVLIRTGTTETPQKEKPEKQEDATKETVTAKKTLTKKAIKEMAQSILLENYSADDFRQILGINVFDDVTWFNKESFERVLQYAPVFAAMECGDFALVKTIAEEFRKAEKKAEYRLGKLIEAFNP
ncbi:MAG: alpha-amylase family glycosyl hydrolase [Treponema sp.]|nr:alpha-amylase family glycosyl hydrolase [Treponema sp.]